MWADWRRVLLVVRLVWIAAQFYLDDAYNNKFRMPRSGGQFLLSRKNCAQQRGRNDFEPFIPDRCLGFLMIATAEENATNFACLRSQLYFFYTAVEKRKLATTLQMERFTIPIISIFVEHGNLQHSGTGWEGSFHSHCLNYFILSHVAF